MRLELFAKDTAGIVASARQLAGLSGLRGLNIPHKSKDANPIHAMQELQGILQPEYLRTVVPHYSLKNGYGGSPANCLRLFEEFYSASVQLPCPPREILLVSGSGSRQFDTVKCLQQLSVPSEGDAPEIGVAFNPFFPDRPSRQRERARLIQKLATGKVSAIWLQIGSDLELLSDGLNFLREQRIARALPLRVYGSVFIPSRQLLAQMRFRPWNGVFLDDEYLSSVEAAEAVTRAVCGLYAQHGVEVLVETAVRSDAEWRHAQGLLGVTAGNAVPRAMGASARDETASAGESSATSASSSLPSSTPPPPSASPDRPAKRARAITQQPPAPALATTASDATVQATPPPPDHVTFVWYRSFDLRCSDHAPLCTAASRGGGAAVVPVFIWPSRRGTWSPGGAARAWLHASLAALDDDLKAIGSRLVLRRAVPSERNVGDDVEGSADAASMARLEAKDTAEALLELIRECNAPSASVVFHRSYEPEGQLVDGAVLAATRSTGIPCDDLAGHLLYEPSRVDMPGGYSSGHWGTLMPFLRACERSGTPPAQPLAKPRQLRPPAAWPASAPLDTLELAPRPTSRDGTPGRDWAREMMSHWRVGEASALRLMRDFVDGAPAASGVGLANYETKRSRADEEGTVSSLSPYLRFGQLSPRHLYHAVRQSGLSRDDTKTFSRRLHWRDLAYYQLAAFPDMPHMPIRRHYSGHAWSADTPHRLRAWQRGQTGYPMVDAGMRCLYATGWLHQSVRMVCASFLVEYLGVSWVHGARWFHETLVDADLAINSMMWQNAGRSGIDQWNFVLSPETGSQDPSGRFCRRWVPELARLSTKHLHAPWLAPPEALQKAGVVLGVDYPHRVLTDLPSARRETVQALLQMRAANLEYNDAGGYDLITLPDGTQSRVFTKQEFRLTAKGEPKPPPPTGSGNRRRGSGAGSSRGGGGGGRGRAGSSPSRGGGGVQAQNSGRGRGGGAKGKNASASDGASVETTAPDILSYFPPKSAHGTSSQA